MFLQTVIEGIYCAPAPIRWGIVLSAVRPSLRAMPEPKSRMEGRRKLRNGRNEAHDRLTRDPF